MEIDSRACPVGSKQKGVLRQNIYYVRIQLAFVLRGNAQRTFFTCGKRILGYMPEPFVHTDET